ncbi:MAG TPA: hypothetical protein ENG01_00940 [Candidatus Aenigmarchaeota archaeon]|nr:hypothetical protein [Candidatus Aenigmarchaeota archaeon]HEX32961.1 hypothetical protein [Candidatus Aenigmarchaeota archaeon]
MTNLRNVKLREYITDVDFMADVVIQVWLAEDDKYYLVAKIYYERNRYELKVADGPYDTVDEAIWDWYE